MEFYRGDTFIFPFSFDDETIKFAAGDVLRFGVKKACDCENYALYKEVTVENETTEIKIVFESSETSKLNPGEYMTELELTKDGVVETCFREKINVLGDIVV